MHQGVWKGGSGAVGLWGCGLAGGSLCAPRAGLTCAQGAPRVGLTCAEAGQRVGLLHRPCQSAAGLYGALWGPVRALCVACMGLCSGGSSILPPVAVASLEVQLRPD